MGLSGLELRTLSLGESVGIGIWSRGRERREQAGDEKEGKRGAR